MVETQGSENTPKKTSVARSSILMASGTLVSRILGMVRSPILLTMVLGLNSPIANAFDVANALPITLFNVIAGGVISAVFVPAIVRSIQHDNDGGQAFLNKLLTLSIVFIGTATIILTLCAPFILKIFASTMSEDWYEIAVYFAYWCIPQVFFYGMYAILGQILNAREKFGAYMWVPVANNIIAIAGLILMLSLFGSPTAEQSQTIEIWQGARVAILAGFTTGGIAAQTLLLIIPLRNMGIRFTFDFHWRGAGLGRAGKKSIWAFLNTFVAMAMSAVAFNVTAGATQRALDAGQNASAVPGNAAFTVSTTLINFPVSLVVLSIVTAMFTKMAVSASSGKIDTLRQQATTTAITVIWFSLLTTALITVFAIPVSRVLVPAGSIEEISSLALVIVAQSIGIIGYSIVIVYDRVCYAMEDTRGAFWTAFPAQIFIALGGILAAMLSPEHTVFAFAGVYSTGNMLNALILLIYLSRKLGSIDGKILLTSTLKLTFAIGIVTALGLISISVFHIDFLAGSMASILAITALGSAIMTLMYSGITRLVGLKDADLLGIFIRRFISR